MRYVSLPRSKLIRDGIRPQAIASSAGVPEIVSFKLVIVMYSTNCDRNLSSRCGMGQIGLFINRFTSR
ncbi:MAG: hypothetical protein V7K35_10745 [Nostoc sp.]|uniref:hypothetical protein n=1 Tax=Nostoc sp. TaxID=1180 RepID=UPI002FF5334F